MGVFCKKLIEKGLAMVLTLLYFFPAVSQNSQTKIEGTIVDEHNQPIPFVSIQVVNTQNGAAANENGRFIINNFTPGKQILKTRSLGY